jgi:hypothetical protein
MKLIFTRSGLPLSKVIRWGLKEPVSHVAIVFDDKLVFQSNLLGVGIEGIYRFKAAAEFVYTIDIPLSAVVEEDIYMNLLKKYDGKPYDFKAFLYFSYRAVLKQLFNTPFPAKNEWGDPNAFLCDGLLAALLDTQCIPAWLREALVSLGDIEIRSPYQAYLAIDQAQLANHYPIGKG